MTPHSSSGAPENLRTLSTHRRQHGVSTWPPAHEAPRPCYITTQHRSNRMAERDQYTNKTAARTCPYLRPVITSGQYSLPGIHKDAGLCYTPPGCRGTRSDLGRARASLDTLISPNVCESGYERFQGHRRAMSGCHEFLLTSRRRSLTTPPPRSGHHPRKLRQQLQREPSEIDELRLRRA